jgi:hypothetical protein
MTSTPWSPNDVNDLDQALIAASGAFTDRTRALLADALDLAQDAMEAEPVAKRFSAAASAGAPGVGLRAVAGHIRTSPRRDPINPDPEPIEPDPEPIVPEPGPVEPDPDEPGPSPDEPEPDIR